MQSEITNLRELIQSALKEHQKLSSDIVLMQKRLNNIELVLESALERLEELEVNEPEQFEEEEPKLTWRDATICKETSL